MSAAILAAASTEAKVLLAVGVVIVAARTVGSLLVALRQPRVVGEIVAGIALGPSVVGALVPGLTDRLFPADVIGALDALAQLGLVLFMLLVGMELDLTSLRGRGHKALAISHTSIALPVLLGALLGAWLHPRLAPEVDRLGFSLFLGAAMAITAFPVLARMLQDNGLARSNIGILTLTCAAIDDVTAWCVLAGVVALVTSSGPADVVQIVALSLAFVIGMVRVVRPMLAHLSSTPLWVVIALALTSAWATDQIGIHAIFGGFMAGVVMPRRPELRAQVHDRVEPLTMTVLLPIFFVVVGLSTRIDALDRPYLWGLAALVTAVATIGKWGGSTVAARITGESWYDANTIGVLMNTRGLTELVILSVGLEVGVINATVFTIMVLMALVTTLMATPLLALIEHVRSRRASPGIRQPAESTPPRVAAAPAVSPRPD